MVLRNLSRKMDDFVAVKAVQLMGGGAASFVRLGKRYEDLNWTEEAMDAYRRAIAADPQYAESYARLGDLFWRQGQETQAIMNCQKAIQLQCPDALAYVTLGQALEKQGKVDDAFKIYRLALTLQHPNETAYRVIGDRFYNARFYEEAVKAYRRAIRLNTNQAAAYGLFPADYEKLKQHPEAVQAFKQAVEGKPSSDGYAILGSACEIMGWHKEAAEAYNVSLRLRDELVYGAFVMTGNDEKQSKKTIQALKRAIQERPHDAALYHQLGAVYVQLKLDVQAIEVLKHAVRINRQSSASWMMFAHAATRLAHHGEAWQAWREVVRINPNDLEAQAHLAGSYINLGRYKEGQQICEKVLQSAPTNAIALMHLGYAQCEQRDFVNAERTLLRALQVHPNVTVLCSLGKVYTAIFHHDKAAAVYRRATQMAAQHADAYVGLGLAYARLNKFDLALQQVDMLRTIDKAKAQELAGHVQKLADRSPIR